MNNLVLKYKGDLDKKKLSLNTLDAYKRDIDKFSEFVTLRGEEIESVEIITIRAYVEQLKKDGIANSTIARNIISIRNFYKYLIKNEIIKYDPTLKYDMPKIKRKIPDILTVEEIDKLLNAPDLSINKGIRDKAMLEVMYACGMKVTELLNLKIFDINIHLKYVVCRGTKNKERIIPVGTYAVNCLKEYLTVRDEINIYKLDYLFLNLKGMSMTRQGFWKMVKGYAEESKIVKKIDPYTLRHSFAVHLLQNGADIKTVQELLGHTGLAATQIYSQISKNSKIAEVYNKAHPRA